MSFIQIYHITPEPRSGPERNLVIRMWAMRGGRTRVFIDSWYETRDFDDAKSAWEFVEIFIELLDLSMINNRTCARLAHKSVERMEHFRNGGL